MTDDKVFISYSSRDAELAETLCAGLEAEGVACWIAPRDVEVGAYAASIVRAIRGARALLFVASEHSAASGHVGRELERAVDAGVPIVPVRIDGAEFSEELEYYLAGMHWLDISGQPVQAVAPELRDRLDGLQHATSSARSIAKSAPSPTNRRRGLSERLLDTLLILPPPLVGIALSVVGATFVLVSAFLGIAEFQYLLDIGDTQPVSKEVGFLWAINWSVSLVIVYPAIAGVGLHALREMAALPERLTRRRMLVDAGFRAAKQGFGDTEIRRALRRGMGVGLVLLVAFCSYALWEFQTVIGAHFDTGQPFPSIIPMDHPFQERDWSVAALLPTIDGILPDRTANYVFALLVYVWLVGFGSTLVLTIFITFVLVAAAIYRLSSRTDGLRIVPDLRDPPGRRRYDHRCGFEVFERLFRYSMMVVLLSFVALYLVNLQNTYIRQPDAHILDYLVPDTSFPNGVMAGLVGGGGVRSALANLNGALSTAVGGLLFAMIVFGLAITLRIGARQAHLLMTERIEDEEEPLPVFLEETDRADALERLDNMRFWPVRWLGINRILVAIVLAGISLVFHKIGMIVVVLALGYGISASFSDRQDGRV